MEDYTDPYRRLRAECAARNVALRDSVHTSLEALADLLTEEDPERLRSDIARFFAYLHCGNDSFNSLRPKDRQQLDAIMIGIPPRRLFELLNDMGRVIESLSLIDMSSSCIRLAFADNALPYRPSEVFSLLDQLSQLVLLPERDNTLVTAQQLADYARCSDRTIRDALRGRCNPVVKSSGKSGGDRWEYFQAVDILKTIESGILKGVEWPESAAELKPRKDSSKIPAKTLKR